MDKYLDSDTLKTYLKRLGFGSKVGLNLPNEVSGKIDFKYCVDLLFDTDDSANAE